MPAFSFPKKERLKSKKEIEALFSEGQQLTAYPIKMFYRETNFNDGTQIKAAVSAPKRNFPRAVDRNRIKRLLREAYRLSKHLVFNNTERKFAFLFLYIGKELPGHVQLEKRMVRLLQQFITHSTRKDEN